jgi:PAS domain S-box-containing protein
MIDSDSAADTSGERSTKVPAGDAGSPATASLLGAGGTESLLDSILTNAPIPIFMKDLEGKYLYANSACEEATGIPRERFLGHTDSDIHSPEIASIARDTDLLAMRSPTPNKTERTVLLNGEERTFVAFKFRIVNDRDEVIGVCGISIDITDNIRTEHAHGVERQRIASEEFFPRLLASLTPQEANVLNLLAEGLSDSQIAERLTLTNGTVRHHVSHLLKKLRKQSRTQAVIEMLKHRRS